MNTRNVLILARNLRKEEEKLLYKNRSSSWKTVFKHHPLESQKNERFFKNIVHSVDKWGSSDILILRSAYTWEILLEISKNSLQDCLSFYELAKNTILYKKGILGENSTNWFKKALTAIYLSHSDASENLNFLSELNTEQKEKSLALAFQFFGTNAIQNYDKLKNHFNIDKFNEKLILWYWDADSRDINLIDKVIDYLNQNMTINYDLNYIAEYFKPNNLLKSQSKQVNERFIPFSDIVVQTKRYISQSDRIYCVINDDLEVISLENIYNLFCCQALIKTLEIKAEEIEKHKQSIVLTGEVRQANPSKFLGEFKYSSLPEIFVDYPVIKELEKSMHGFIELNLSKNKENKNYWNEVNAIFLSQILNNDLENKEIIKNKRIKI